MLYASCVVQAAPPEAVGLRGPVKLAGCWLLWHWGGGLSLSWPVDAGLALYKRELHKEAHLDVIVLKVVSPTPADGTPALATGRAAWTIRS